MSKSAVHLPVIQGAGATTRKDAWWVGPAITASVLLAFIVYATFRAFENHYFEGLPADDYLSPFYSPHIPTERLGIGFLTPAMLILPGPASFRLTCYYYRKAYYRSIAMSPPACSVGGVQRDYKGETALLLFQNLHRFTMYVALLFLVFLWHDVWKALWFTDDGVTHFGIAVGTVVMFLNTTLLTLYTTSCHSLRHLVGGGINSYSTHPFGRLRYALWRVVSRFNEDHMRWAWCSLISVASTDAYIRFVSLNVFPDIRIL